MKANKQLEIGITAIGLIKKSKAPIKTSDLAEAVGTTVGFLEQIMKKLRKSQLVLAKHGPGGGYIYNPSRGTLTAFDVACSLGYEFAPFINRESPVIHERLNGEIIDAFLRTEI